jgi:hypothetical protein
MNRLPVIGVLLLNAAVISHAQAQEPGHAQVEGGRTKDREHHSRR